MHRTNEVRSCMKRKIQKKKITLETVSLFIVQDKQIDRWMDGKEINM